MDKLKLIKIKIFHFTKTHIKMIEYKLQTGRKCLKTIYNTTIQKKQCICMCVYMLTHMLSKLNNSKVKNIISERLKAFRDTSLKIIDK
jgi:hypothetical protein